MNIDAPSTTQWIPPGVVDTITVSGWHEVIDSGELWNSYCTPQADVGWLEIHTTSTDTPVVIAGPDGLGCGCC